MKGNGHGELAATAAALSYTRRNERKPRPRPRNERKPRPRPRNSLDESRIELIVEGSLEPTLLCMGVRGCVFAGVCAGVCVSVRCRCVCACKCVCAL